MLLEETLAEIIEIQGHKLKKLDPGTPRELLKDVKPHTSHVVIISGIRRCGKSTLLRQMINKADRYNYFNFEDRRAIGFELADFDRLITLFEKRGDEGAAYFFDEIQAVPGWETVVRGMLDEGKKIVMAGSSASLLSKELGTKLTGRHLTYELFPMSYEEMLKYMGLKASASSFEDYFNWGGFPEYLKDQDDYTLQQLLGDILLKDIVIRYGLREYKVFEGLVKYLLTNIGKEFTYNKLRYAFGLGSANTIISYISYLEDAYLLFTVPKFSYSYKERLVNPKKVYAIDNGLIKSNTLSFSEDKGRLLENIVYLHLRRKYRSIYYYKGKHECDLLVQHKNSLLMAVQVCYKLDEHNKERELNGLREAMDVLKVKNGLIITFNQEDELDGIKIVPAWKWMSEAVRD